MTVSSGYELPIGSNYNSRKDLNKISGELKAIHDSQ